MKRSTGVLLALSGSLAALGVAHAGTDRRPSQRAQTTMPVAVVESVFSQTPTVSADGRWVVYAGNESNQSKVWLKDRVDNSVVDLTPSRDGIRIGETVWPVISGDGCTVTVVTELALDLFRDDDLEDRWDVYRLVLTRCGGDGEWELVSATGGSGSGIDVTASDDVSPLYPPAVSADGNTVAFTHGLYQTDHASPDEILGVTVVDLTVAIGQVGRNTKVAGTPSAAPESTFRYRGLREPSISADGLVLAFSADIAVNGDNWGSGVEPGEFATSHVYVWDRRELAAVPLTAISTVGTGATGDSTSPAVSGNGQVIAFVSTATNLIPGAVLPPCGAVCLPQVYLFDRVANSLTLASRQPADPASAGDPAPPLIAANAGATQPALSYGGEELLFVSRSTNLFPTRSPSVGDATDGDIILAIPALGTLDRVSVLADGITPAPAANSHPKISTGGRVVVFDTLAGAVYGATPVSSGASVASRNVAIVDHMPSLTLANLDVGTVAVGFPGPEWFLVVSNNGPSTFLPATAEITGDHASDFLISGGSCLNLDPSVDPSFERTISVPPGGSCTVKLMLMPSVAGERNATLTVTESKVGDERAELLRPVAISAQLTGFGGEPSLAPDPAAAYAGTALVGTNSAPLIFKVSNVAFGTTRIADIAITGDHPDDFYIAHDACDNVSLDASTTCELHVIFTPTAGGRRSAQVLVTSRDGAYATMLLSGDAFYDPAIVALNPTIVAGSRLNIAGSGFAPNATVTLSWADGSGGTVTAVTNVEGDLNAQIVVRATDRSGLRTLVAQVPGESSTTQVAMTEVLIVSPSNTRGPNSPAWPGN